MPYPPAVPPATRTNATVMATNHPADHNAISAALTEILNHIATMETSLYPIGTISITGADLAAGNHLLCQGQAISRTAYPEVFALYGTKFGVGDGANTFNLPDFRGKYPIGFNAGSANGTYFTAGLGEKYGSPDAILPTHDHGDAHEHGVNIYTTYTDVDHYHVSAVPGSNGFFINGGTGDQGNGAFASGGVPVAINSRTSLSVVGGQTGLLNHRHAVNGGTDSGPTKTSAAGVAATNGNLPPSLSVNYQIRVH